MSSVIIVLNDVTILQHESIPPLNVITLPQPYFGTTRNPAQFLSLIVNLKTLWSVVECKHLIRKSVFRQMLGIL